MHDPRRINYLHEHIGAVGAAIDSGIDVRGCFAWSLLDNIEWSYGYDRRFGLIFVRLPDPETNLEGLGSPVPRRHCPRGFAGRAGAAPH